MRRRQPQKFAFEIFRDVAEPFLDVLHDFSLRVCDKAIATGIDAPLKPSRYDRTAGVSALGSSARSKPFTDSDSVRETNTGIE